MVKRKTAVVALGGNAITVPGQEDTIANQFENTRKSLDGVVELAKQGYGLVVSHGNGPQVGNALLRIELARGKAPILPLGVLVADTEGGMGYMIEQSLQNSFHHANVNRPVVTLITQMLVDKNDPAFKNPTKYIGQFYTEKEAAVFSETRGWKMKADANRGWRRVVPSPAPLGSTHTRILKNLVESGTVVIAGGGGGIPVYYDENRDLEGIDAVIDKDLASAVMAREIGAGVLVILTSVDSVSINFGKPNEEKLGTVKVSAMEKYLDEEHFAPGSMKPKIKAAIQFIREGGEMVTITSFEHAAAAIDGNVGTRIIPD